MGIAVGSSGNVYVVDAGNNRIQKFDSSGTFLLSRGSQGTGDGRFVAPSGIAADNAGHIFVVDTNNSRVQVFDEEGNFIESWGRYGSGKREFIFFNYPYFQGIAVNPSGTVIYVADTANNRIQGLAGYSVPSFVFTAGPHGAIVGSTEQTVSFGGSTKPVTAIARHGYRFRDWTDAAGNVVSRSNPLVLTAVTASMELTANFEPRCKAASE